MDCSNARLWLQLRTPGGDELAAEEREELDAHLAGCPLCRAMDHDQQRFDDHVGRALRAVPVPAGLRGRLLDAVMPPAPGRAPRRWLRRAGAGLGLATAASLGLLVWGWYYWRGPLKPPVWPDRVQMGYLATLPRDVDAVNAQFRILGERLCAPDWADYNHLSNPPALAVLPGSTNEKAPDRYKVPHLIFTNRDGDEVKMFILSHRKFDVGDYEPADYGPAGPNLAVYRPDGPDGKPGPYSYLMLYKGRHWDWIKRRDAGK